MDDVLCYLMVGVERGFRKFTQKGVSDVLGVSVGSVNYTVNKLASIGAVVKGVRGFEVVNPKKLLLFWTVHHKIKVCYSSHVRLSAYEIEGMMPPGIFTAYSGARLYYGIDSADYSEVYIYVDCDVVREWFVEFESRSILGELRPNVFCLKPLRCFDVLNLNSAPLSLLYVDLFNLDTWYSVRFLKDVEVRLNAVLE